MERGKFHLGLESGHNFTFYSNKDIKADKARNTQHTFRKQAYCTVRVLLPNLFVTGFLLEIQERRCFAVIIGCQVLGSFSRLPARS
jgi:hypothetical protein